MRRRKLLLFLCLLLLGILVVNCAPAGEDGAGAEAQQECPEVPTCPSCPEPICPEPEAAQGVPFNDAWESSAHAAVDTEPFRHWDEDDPQEVPTTCAKCHTSGGFRDFVGADGSAFGSVEAAQAPEQMGITCGACHNDATVDLGSVVMPSGVEITGLGGSAICMQCHQGRQSAVNVNLRIAGAEETPESDPVGYTLLEGIDLDTVSEELGFANIHYYPAAATLFGSETHGGYEFAGKVYQIRTSHVEDYNECIDCHNQHTLEVRVEECTVCHEGVTEESLHDIRMNGSLADYDGDGDREEGVYFEMEGLAEQLYLAMQAYSTNVVGTAITYNSQSYPYFFDDTGEAYAAWTPHLLMAAYNYQMFQKDPGAFAHNPKYHIALLYDSIEALGEDVTALTRNDPGHFDGTAEAFRHWDENDPAEVPASCARCHSGEGIPPLLKNGVNIGAKPANGYQCTNCHVSLGGEWPRYEAGSATFPSGATVSFEDNPDANLCIQCHQGLESSLDVEAAIIASGVGPDAVMEGQRFINIHYFPAGVSLFGNTVNGAYQYAGKTYVGQNEHVKGADSCVECHNVHALEVNQDLCANCHEQSHHQEYRMREGDFDGDGNDTEGIGQEVEGMMEALYAAMQAYAESNPNTDPIVYNAHRYPYFFNEAGDQYATFTPKLLRAAYNYQYAQKDPGAFAHNPDYILQILYDSIQDVGGNAAVAGMTRP